MTKTTDELRRFLVVNTPRAGAGMDATVVSGHIAFLAEHEAAGAVTMSGPFPAGGGAYVVVAPADADAWALVRTDPLYPVADFSVREWRLPSAGATS